MSHAPAAERAHATVQTRSRLRYRLVASAINGVIFSTLIGAVGALVRVGPDQFWGAFAQGAPIGFATAFPVSLVVVPVVQRLVDRLFGLNPPD
ncbi:DUF2798 domain-containing protein [Sphingomonas sp. Leaf25]|uniref:DUF2798 domain-containing protein n=1 Tax=Sphingomonas sp. Leaf25 TaxID=1735692 RepID=UPI0006F77185|nr:DUF2798 domain-containing protein [Sphingomonas sp. Leaf25]KQN00460.1 hypothetical protein ASE78_04990 [Sphingomonas sp. Leaf25]